MHGFCYKPPIMFAKIMSYMSAVYYLFCFRRSLTTKLLRLQLRASFTTHVFCMLRILCWYRIIVLYKIFVLSISKRAIETTAGF